MQQRIEQHFRTKAEHFGLKTEGKDLKEVRKRNYYYRRSEEKERMYGEQHKRFVYKQKEKTMDELIKDVRKKVKK